MRTWGVSTGWIRTSATAALLWEERNGTGLSSHGVLMLVSKTPGSSIASVGERWVWQSSGEKLPVCCWGSLQGGGSLVVGGWTGLGMSSWGTTTRVTISLSKGMSGPSAPFPTAAPSVKPTVRSVIGPYAATTSKNITWRIMKTRVNRLWSTIFFIIYVNVVWYKHGTTMELYSYLVLYVDYSVWCILSIVKSITM